MLADKAVAVGVSVLFGVAVDVAFLLWYLQANLRTLGFPPAAFGLTPLVLHASCLHPRRVVSLNIQHLAWELISKSISPMMIIWI